MCFLFLVFRAFTREPSQANFPVMRPYVMDPWLPSQPYEDSCTYK